MTDLVSRLSDLARKQRERIAELELENAEYKEGNKELHEFNHKLNDQLRVGYRERGEEITRLQGQVDALISGIVEAMLVLNDDDTNTPKRIYHG